jgi:outer membrane receptor protein involved in Fe transport
MVALLPLLAGAVVRPAALAAQQYTVRGAVVDSVGAPLSGAMVVALTRVDSVIAVFATTSGKGQFSLGRVVPGEYILQVTRIGFAPVLRDFAVRDADVQADTVVMAKAAVELDELVVNAEHIPIVNKRDTLEYNAAAFRTRPNAVVEDLLARLPGVEVTTDGTIKAQGEEVRKVLVDGKEFFGSDPKIATKNLPADAVDRVKVFDKRSDAAEFTGIDDGNEEKTIDLILKEDARTGYFGSVLGGVGPGAHTASAAISPASNARYATALGINRFSPTTQAALIGSGNNVGQTRFSLGNAVALGEGGGGSGYTESISLGLNLSRQFSARRWIRGSYFFGNVDNRQDRTLSEQQLQGASVASLRNEASNETAETMSHTLNLNAQHAFTDWHQLRLRGNFSLRDNTRNRLTQQATEGVDGTLKNRATSSLASTSDNLNANASLTWQKRFNQAGRSLVAEIGVDLGSPDLSSDLASLTAVANGAGGLDSIDLLQRRREDGRTLETSARLGLTEPLGGGHTVELFTRYRTVDEDRDLRVDDIVAGSPIPNDLLSSGFDRSYSYVQGGTSLSRNTESTRWVLGLQAQHSTLEGVIRDRDETISNGYTHLLPSANLRWQVGDGKNVSMNYRTSTREPSLTELQPFVDNTDPLRTYEGNPNLQPQYSHNLRADYRYFDQFTFVNFFTYASLSHTRDRIVQARTIDDAGRQTLRPTNLGHGWSTNLGANLGLPIRAIGAHLDLSYALNRSTGIELVNAVENRSRNLSHNVGIRLRNRSRDVIDLSGGVGFNLRSVHYSLNDELDRNYLTTSLSGTANWFPYQAWTLGVTGSYQINDRDLVGNAGNNAQLSASISRLLVDGRGELKLSGNNLLDQNRGVSVTSNASYIREQRTATLGRYAMLTFTWRLGNRGGGGGPRGGRDIEVRRVGGDE